MVDLETVKHIFGDFNRRVIATDTPELNAGDYVALVNSNCEFEFDSIAGCFNKNLLYYFIVDLELKDLDLTGYVPEKSNNGGAYGFCTCKVLKVHGKSY